MMRAPAFFRPLESSMRDEVRRALALLSQTEPGEALFLIALIVVPFLMLALGGA
jgi:hypothetical protein